MIDNELRNHIDRLLTSTSVESRHNIRWSIKKVTDSGVKSVLDLQNAVFNQRMETEIRTIICWLLARMDIPHRSDILIKALSDPTPEVRRSAAQALGESGDVRALPPLQELALNDETEMVRMLAVYGLGEIRNKQAVPTLVKILTNENDSEAIRGQAAESLGQIGDRSTVPVLIEMLHNQSIEVRFWAIFSLGKLNDKRAISHLQEIAATDDSELEGWGRLSDEASEAVKMIKG